VGGSGVELLSLKMISRHRNSNYFLHLMKHLEIPSRATPPTPSSLQNASSTLRSHQIRTMNLIIRLLRIALYALLTWLALAALWLGLPSPSREYHSHPNRYAYDTLHAGHALVRCYNTRAYDTDGYPAEFPSRESRHSFVLSYRIEQQRNTTLLYLQDGLTIDLSPSYVTSYPFTSQEKYALANTGDQDGINPPWFTTADSTLLFWWIHGDKAKIALKVYWRDAHNIEIWPAQTTVDDAEDGPLLRLSFDAPPGNFGNRLHLLQDVNVPSRSSSPSATYAIRVVILMVIAPTGLLVIGLISVLGPVVEFAWELALFFVKIFGFYCAALLVVWVFRGRRPVAEDDFVSRFPGMEFFGGRGAGRNTGRGRRTVWGPSGPIEIENEDETRIPRRPIRNVADFFRSSAPLDDLLASFEITRRFTEPVGWRYRSGARRDVSLGQTASDGEMGRHRRAYSEDGLEESGLIDLEKALPEKPEIVLKR
jgi:hypothetical protein